MQVYILDMHSTDITNLLRKLVDEEYLKSDNNGRWTIYELNLPKVDSSTQKVDSSETKVDSSTPKVDSSETKVDSSTTQKVDSSNRKVDSSKTQKVDTPKKLSKEDLELLIMNICRNDYVTMENVAKEINRSFDYLKNKIFPKMIKTGKLKKKFPYTNNHPEQAYKTNF